MSDLQGVPLHIHLDYILSPKNRKYLYSLPKGKVFSNFSDVDLSVKIFGKTAATPIGPAAGPHTQLVQNIIMAYLAGGRVIELKTIQIKDNLEIERPCIDIRNIGYNVEWSQELTLHNSYQEYLNAWIILHILRNEDFLETGENNHFYDLIFDMSVGYNFAGIQSKIVSDWIKRMKQADDFIQQTLNSLPERYNQYKSLNIPGTISDSITLSTFHGCPVQEIEQIVKFLISEHQLNVIIKMNPTILGYDFVKSILHDELGYTQIELDPVSFNTDLQLEDAVSLMHRLQQFAKIYNQSIGVKFTNTLVVKNTESIFKSPIRYLSGPPLYAIAMNSMHRFREEFGFSLPISFSGGINRDNFADAVSCGLNPVTTCTDLLKKGGYSRMKIYLDNLRKTMLDLNAKTIDEFILKKADLGEIKILHEAYEKNTVKVLQSLLPSKLYHNDSNKNFPAKIKSMLSIYDCLNCDICIPVCPNGANFYYKVVPGKYVGKNYKLTNIGKLQRTDTNKYNVTKSFQIGNIAEFCNDCGNCETFCPEQGAPYLEKMRFFLNDRTFEKSANRDGVFIKSDSEMFYRNFGHIYKLELMPNDKILWSSEIFKLSMSANGEIQSVIWFDEDKIPISIDGLIFQTMISLLSWYKKYPESFPANISDQQSVFFS